MQGSHRGGFSCADQTLAARVSVAVAHGLSCSESYEIFLDQGWNLCPLHWQADSLLLSHQGSPGHNLLTFVFRNMERGNVVVIYLKCKINMPSSELTHHILHCLYFYLACISFWAFFFHPNQEVFHC